MSPGPGSGEYAHKLLERGSRCERCGQHALATIMSRFNTDTLCLDCAKKERAHPQYAEAVRVENEAVRRGDFNFPGIGKPADL